MSTEERVNEQLGMLGRKVKTEKYYIRLEPSERALLAAASRIVAAMISSGQYAGLSDAEKAGKAIELAISMAQQIDAVVEADSEGESGGALPK